MSKSSQAYLDDIERRIASGEIDRMVDPYVHDIAVNALKKIVAGHGDPIAVARVAIERIEDRGGTTNERKHKRCELCADNPPTQPHCWVIEKGKYGGKRYAECRHCQATAEVCPDCDGCGVSYYPFDGKDVDDELDCQKCQGWGVLPPKEVR